MRTPSGQHEGEFQGGGGLCFARPFQGVMEPAPILVSGIPRAVSPANSPPDGRFLSRRLRWPRRYRPGGRPQKNIRERFKDGLNMGISFRDFPGIEIGGSLQLFALAFLLPERRVDRSDEFRRSTPTVPFRSRSIFFILKF